MIENIVMARDGTHQLKMGLEQQLSCIMLLFSNWQIIIWQTFQTICYQALQQAAF